MSPLLIVIIADIQKLPDILRKRGYTDTNIENVMYLNYVRFLKGYFNK